MSRHGWRTRQLSLTLQQGFLLDFQSDSGGGGVPFRFFRGFPSTVANPQGGAGHSFGGPLLISSSAQEQRTLPEENCLFTDQLVHSFPDTISSEPFFPKRMFHFILSAVFISVWFMWIYFYQRTVGLMHEHTFKYTFSLRVSRYYCLAAKK